MINKIIAGLLLVFFALTGCSSGESAKAVDLDAVLSVSDYSFMLSGQPAAIVNFGGDQKNYVSVTVIKSNVNEGYSIQSVRRSGSSQIDADVLWQGVSYVQSSKHDTSISFEIVALDAAQRRATVKIEGVFVEAATDRYIAIANQSLVISGVDYDNLTKD